MAEVKLKDIAQRAGVSTVTVSNALSGKKGVSKELRDQIFSLAKELGYDLSRYQPKSSEGLRIGVIASRMYVEEGNSFYWAFYQQVIFAAAKSGSVTTLEILDQDMQKTKQMPRILQGKKSIDALIVIGWIFEPYIRWIIQEAHIPVVLLDFRLEGSRCESVLSDNMRGMYKSTRYLIEHGHRDIAFVGSILANENIMDRYYGYRKAMMEAGLPIRPEWVLEDRDLFTGNVHVTLPEALPTAFACNNDLAAQHVFEALEKRGLTVPGDISLASYDNYLPWHPLSKILTSYNVDMERMAEMAVERVLSKIYGEDAFFGVQMVDSHMVEKSSVKDLTAEQM